MNTKNILSLFLVVILWTTAKLLISISLPFSSNLVIINRCTSIDLLTWITNLLMPLKDPV